MQVCFKALRLTTALLSQLVGLGELVLAAAGERQGVGHSCCFGKDWNVPTPTPKESLEAPLRSAPGSQV